MNHALFSRPWKKADPFVSVIVAGFICFYFARLLIYLNDGHNPYAFRVGVRQSMPRHTVVTALELLVLAAFAKGKPFAFWSYFLFDLFLLASTVAYRLGGIRSIWATRSATGIVLQLGVVCYCVIRILQIRVEKEKSFGSSG